MVAAVASQMRQNTNAAGQNSADQHADIGGDALAALELEPDREEVAEEGAERRPASPH